LPEKTCETCVEYRQVNDVYRKEIHELRKRVTDMAGMIFEINEIITDVKRYPFIMERYKMKYLNDIWMKNREG